jgi:hypothetical protein
VADPSRLLRSLGETKGSRAAVLTSYNVSFRFFEHVVLPRLRGVGCQHVLLLLDAARFSEVAHDPELRPQLAGTLYTVIPVTVPGAFHPKLLMQVGEKGGRLWVGSHNLTMAGFNHNREVTTAVDARLDEEAQAIMVNAWRSVREWLPPSAVAEEAAEAVERLAPWLVRSVGSDRGARVLLSSTPQRPLWPHLRRLLPSRAERVTVVGPFFDNQLEFLDVVLRDLSPAELLVGLLPGQTQFPSARRALLPPHVRFVHAGILLGNGTPYLHAKAMLVESTTQSVLVVGSANPSAPAFLGGLHPNCEAVVVHQVDRESDVLGLRDLQGAPTLADSDWEKLPAQIQPDPGSPGVPVRLGAAFRGEIELDEPVEEVEHIRFVGEDQELLGASSHQGRCAKVSPPQGTTLEEVRWLELVRGEGLVARVLVHHRRLLRRLCRTGAEQKLTEVLHTLETLHPDWVDLLGLIDPLLDEPLQTRRVNARASVSEWRGTHFGSGGAEAMVRSEASEALYGTEGPLGEVMLYLHHRLGVTVDGLDQSEEDLVDSEDEALLEVSVPEPNLDERERIRGRFDRLTRKLARKLTVGQGSGPSVPVHERMAFLAAVLGVAHATIRRTPPRPRQRLEHLRLAPVGALERLLCDGVAAALVRRDLWQTAQQLGPEAEEVRIIPVLLAWLCCELRRWPPGSSQHGGRRRRPGHDEADLTHRALWLALMPTLDGGQWDRLLGLVMLSDSDPEALDWYEGAQRSAEHLRSVMAEPERYLVRTGRGQPGDLVLFGRDTLRVLQKDIGGPADARRLVWPEPGKPAASKQLDRGHLLLPAAWGRNDEAL